MKNVFTTILIVLVFFGLKEIKYYFKHRNNNHGDVQTVQQLQQAQQNQYQPNQAEALLSSDNEGLVREDAIGLTSIAFKEGYEWAQKYQIINPEWCSNQDKQGDFILGCEEYALEQSGE